MEATNTLTAALEASDVRVHHATKAKALRLEAALTAEYPGVSMDFSTDDNGKPSEWLFDAGEHSWSSEDGKVPELADVLEGLGEAGATEEDLVGEQVEDEEEVGGKSVVLETYRQQYRVLSTNKQTNGDWLAETLTALFWDTKAGFNVSGFEALLDLNGVDLSAPWAQVLGTKGGAGRFRMNGRQALEKRLCVSEVFKGLDEPQTPLNSAEFAAWLADAKERHAGYLAKLAKKVAKEEAAQAEPAGE